MSDQTTASLADSKQLRVDIADDEPLGRERLRVFLEQEKGFELIAECMTGEEALEVLRSERPDVAILDIQMPGKTGLQVVQELGADAPRGIIFITAYQQFAVDAFELHAVDYLQKPYDRSRFRTALDRARKRIAAGESDALSAQLQQLIAQLNRPKGEGSHPTEPPATAPAKLPSRIAVKSTGKVVFVEILEIDWVGSADNYVELHVGTHTHLLRETMVRISERLPTEHFVRISRTAIVNIHRVKELRPLFHGEYSVLLNNGTKLTLSRSHRDQLPRLGVQ